MLCLRQERSSHQMEGVSKVGMNLDSQVTALKIDGQLDSMTLSGEMGSYVLMGFHVTWFYKTRRVGL